MGMKQLTRLYLFIHPVPRREETRQEYMPKWDKLFMDEGADETIALCILSNNTKEMADLESMGERSFGERCIMDPHDISDQTKVLLAEDLLKTFGGRGHDGEWLPYEIWTAGLARKWTEGLKKSLDSRGFTYDPEQLHLVTCGQQWGGCLTKYSALMAKYLGLIEAPDIRADLSPDAGHPMKAKFLERVEIDQHVYLFLFKMPDGRLMA